ncbi:MAG: hypothetical protein LBT20_07030 [Clostridiales bacterium]|jgi:hypothetical protein|nr:hypothetical protein [Clostridiales bacterium]
MDYSSLKKAIFERQSVREYTDAPVPALDGDVDFVKAFGLTEIFPAPYKIVLLKDGEAVKNKRSKYCIGFYASDDYGSLENVGFVGELLSLYLHTIGVGTCWWGMKKPDRTYRTEDGLSFCISMSAGIPTGSLTRTPDGFKRNAVTEIANESDGLIEAVRVAPSAMNNQPWKIEKKGNAYHFYIKKPKNLLERFFLAEMRKIDTGIAMAHLYVAALADGYTVTVKADGQNTADATYVATLKIEK